MTRNIAATVSVPTTTAAIQLTVKATTTDYPQQHTVDRIMQEFPTIFDGQIRMMEGEVSLLLLEGCPILCENTAISTICLQ